MNGNHIIYGIDRARIGLFHARPVSTIINIHGQSSSSGSTRVNGDRLGRARDGAERNKM
ncbi:hypothetical protein M404DRAFT_1004195, partial [Pisolithus tinctorius Marx 270]